jgi:hypothetical protein
MGGGITLRDGKRSDLLRVDRHVFLLIFRPGKQTPFRKVGTGDHIESPLQAFVGASLRACPKMLHFVRL